MASLELISDSDPLPRLSLHRKAWEDVLGRRRLSSFVTPISWHGERDDSTKYNDRVFSVEKSKEKFYEVRTDTDALLRNSQIEPAILRLP